MSRRISGRTRVLGVIGDPVHHSLSPAMHGAALEATGLDYTYVAFHVHPAQLAGAIQGMRALEIAGLNVTVPHKPAALELVDEVTPEVHAIGAVNTIVNTGDRLIGHNTDAFGVLESLRRDLGAEILPACVAVLGAGGAARAVLYAMLQRPEVERIVLANRTPAHAEALARRMDHRNAVAVTSLRGCADELRDAGLLINTTSVGLYPHGDVSPLPNAAGLHDGMLVLDTVYDPAETLLIRQARAAGARAVNGLGMLAYQGAKSFQIWTGKWPPVRVMFAALGSNPVPDST